MIKAGVFKLQLQFVLLRFSASVASSRRTYQPRPFAGLSHRRLLVADGPGEQKVARGRRVLFSQFLGAQIAVNAQSRYREFSLPPKNPL